MQSRQDLTCNFLIRRNRRSFTVILQCLRRHFESLVLLCFELKIIFLKANLSHDGYLQFPTDRCGTRGTSGMQEPHPPASLRLSPTMAAFLKISAKPAKSKAFLPCQGNSQGHLLPRVSQAGTSQAGKHRLSMESAKETRGQEFLLHCTRCFHIQATAFIHTQTHLAPV